MTEKQIQAKIARDFANFFQMTPKKKTIQIDRKTLDKADKAKTRFISKTGLSKKTVEEISAQKNEPVWMLKKRLEALNLFVKTAMPTWGPSLANLNLDKINYFIRPDAESAQKWQDVPITIRKTFDRLGIPEAEKKALAGVGAQYDSDVVYHKIKKDLEKRGVIFENMDVAVQKYPKLTQKYFMNCVPAGEHKFVMLHGAVWSGGTFIYVPKNVKVELPLQAYFRMNAKAGGQFEHTLIIADEGSSLHYIEGCSAPRYNVSSLHAGCVEIYVKEGAKMRYTSIENWSKDTFNLNTKRAIVEKDGSIEWIGGNMGSGTTMLYPSSVLKGEGASSRNLSIVFAGPGQHQDVGAKAIHLAPHTSSLIESKSISAGGVSVFRGTVEIKKEALNSTTHTRCDSLLLTRNSAAHTIPQLKIHNDQVEAGHEAKVGRIGEEEIFFLQSRGLSEKEATRLIVNGFIEPIIKALPLEYALELNKLIELEMEGAVG